MSKKISVIVPIKGGYEYIKSIIYQANKIKSDEFELIIQDNTENNEEIKRFLESNINDNIKYYHHSQPLNMTENFEEGIKKSSGEYVCIIGADDNFSSKILEIVDYLLIREIESAIFNKAVYYWPGMKFKAHHKRPNLTIKKTKGNIARVNARLELELLLKKGMVTIGNLPSPYQGIIKRELLEKIHSITGRYIPGACPDMAMAVSLSTVVTNHVYIDIPIIISGQSYNSAGGKGARGEHKGDLKNKSFLPDDIEKKWPSFIPKIWTGPTIYADSMNSSLISLGQEDMLKIFNKEANYAYIVSFFPEYKSLVSSFMVNNIRGKIKLSIYAAFIFAKRSKMYVKNFLTTKSGITNDAVYDNITRSDLACDLVDEYADSFIHKLHSQK
jgi:glycosyltransferase involved in cell wall biosynthesis